MEKTVAHTKRKRYFLPQDVKMETWDQIRPYFDQLEQQIKGGIHSIPELSEWLRNLDELQAAIQEKVAWAFINMTRNTQDEAAAQHYQFMVEKVVPEVTRATHTLWSYYIQNPLHEELPIDGLPILNRMVKREVELFREANVTLKSKDELLGQQYHAIQGAMTVKIDGKELTIQQANIYLEDLDPEVRRTVWLKIQERRQKERERLHKLLDEMIALRQQMAKNAGFSNYYEFRFHQLGRFDYTPEDVLHFHGLIANYIRPLYTRLMQYKARQLRQPVLHPWDQKVDVLGQPALKPFNTTQELIDKTIAVFEKMDYGLADIIKTMRALGHFDLDSRVGKAPGGYNYPLYETGYPFVFMNAVGSHSDLITMLHECGHAVHSVLVKDFDLHLLKDTPSEVAELASMSMEFLTLPYWDVFYPNPKDYRRAIITQIYRAVSILPWIATVDAFQQWLYTNPDHSHEERENAFRELYFRFHGTESVNWTGYEDILGFLWQRQLHIFEIPFYYIEYGFAQLGALQVWRRSEEHHTRAVENYLDALKLGYKRTIPRIYETAGVHFLPTPAMLDELRLFIREELRRYGVKSTSES